jgi:acetyl-CoA acetyltransferase
MSIQRKYGIVGVAETDWSKNSGRTPHTLALQAVRAAMEDAGLGPADIDGIMTYSEVDSSDPLDVANGLGIRPNYYMDIFGGGSSTEFLVGTAAAAIDAGMAHTIVIFRAMNGRSGVRMGTDSRQRGVFPGAEFMMPYGYLSPAQMFSLMCQRHMSEYGTTKEHLGHVALTFREHANRNPKAIFYDRKLDMDTYLNARPISLPFQLYDCSLETDGANAIIVTSLERAKDLKQPPISIAGVAGRVTKERGDFLQDPDFTRAAAKYVAPRVFSMAGVGPADIDVAAIYDCFTFPVITQLEDYGFVEKGEGGPFVAEGNLKIGGRLPTNTAGGMLSEAYTNGMNNVVELVRQLRHDYEGTDRQVKNANVGLATGWATPSIGSAMVLERV